MKLIKTLAAVAVLSTAVSGAMAQENNLLQGELVPPTTLALSIIGIITVLAVSNDSSTSSTD